MIEQYYFVNNWRGRQILWVRKQVVINDQDQLGHIRKSYNATVERPATAAEAAALLPLHPKRED